MKSVSRQHWTIIALLLSIGLFYLFTLREGHNPGGDYAQYILHAKAIADGRPYQNTGYIYNPHYPQLGPRIYPPVYPLILAPAIKAFGVNLKALKILNLVFFLLSLWTFYLLIKDKIPFLYSLSAVMIIGMNPFFWNFKDSVLSDIPFLLLVLLSLYYIDRSYAGNKQKNRVVIRSLICGSLLYLAYGTRTAGMALLPAFFVADWIRNRKVSLFFIGSVGFFAVFVILQGILFPGGGSYLDQFHSLTPSVVLRNVLIYIDSLILLWDNGMPHGAFLRMTVFIVISVFAAIGYISRLKKISVVELFPVFYLALIVLWPSPQGARFMIPLIPLFLYYAFLGIKSVANPLIRRLAFGILMILILVSYVGKYRTLNFGPIQAGYAQNGMPDFCEYIENHTARSGVLMCSEPRIYALYSQRQASSYFQPENDAVMWNYLRTIHATHFAVQKDDPAFIGQFIERNKGRFELIYKDKGFSLYRIVL